MNERNPERDWPIIRARQDLVDTTKELARKPSPFNALEVQAKRIAWEAASRLELAKQNGDNGNEQHR